MGRILSAFTILAIFSSGCTNEKVTTSGNVPQDVYVAGFVEAGLSSQNNVAVYWKNGTLNVLATSPDPPVPIPNASSNGAMTSSIFVSGTGLIYAAGTNSGQAVYWQNGKAVELALNASANSIFVTGSGDVYVAGRTNNQSTPIASYWKNGTPVSLTSGSNVDNANSIFVSSAGDVYVAGSTVVSESPGFSSAVYWKNGTQVVLNYGAANAVAKSIIVTGNDVYVAGYIQDLVNHTTVATYWKNGIAYSLPDPSNFSFSTSIFVTGTGDVYLAGFVNGNPTTIAAYWKNGVSFPLSANGVVTDVSSIVVSPSGDIYVSGTVGQHAVYWKNNELQMLNDNGANGSVATSIFLHSN